jgi:hypothetical protein
MTVAPVVLANLGQSRYKPAAHGFVASFAGGRLVKERLLAFTFFQINDLITANIG